jgi:predicted dehydrogenase
MSENLRRNFVKTAALATTALSYSRIYGANDKLRMGFIGVGKMGSANLGIGGRTDGIEVASICDVYQPNLDAAMDKAKTDLKASPKAIKDFREVMADSSIDAVCISTPDHWHAYMTVEACKAGKDVYVEKPVCLTVEEGVKMVQAARKYNKVVQAGTMQRSGEHFIKATDIVKSGKIGQVTHVQTWNVGLSDPEGIKAPADGPVPAGLDWNMWQGPAQEKPFNINRFGQDIEAGPADKQKWFPHFRWFWDYAGGMMTDWGVHLIDIAHMGLGEKMPRSVATMGGKYRLKDNRETPDTIFALYEYDGFTLTYHNRYGNGNSLVAFMSENKITTRPYGTLFHGDKGTLYVDRAMYVLIPERGAGFEAEQMMAVKKPTMNDNHWANFVSCTKSRQKPQSDIEICQRSSTACLLANVSLRSGVKVDFDEKSWSVKQSEAKRFTSKPERKPWVIKV